MIKKVKVDERTRAVIRNGVTTGQRSIFVITGDKPHDQIAKLYFILREEGINRDLISKEVVWCYGDKLVLRSRKMNVGKQVKSLRRYGVLDLEKGPPFSIFLEFTPITPCGYKDSERILGNNTFGMCVLRDFEALTPNLLATTIETVDVGGLVILLIPSWQRFPTESLSGGVDESFLLSLASCRPYIVMDDELNILPISPEQEEDVGVGGLHQTPHHSPRLAVYINPSTLCNISDSSSYHHHHHHHQVFAIYMTFRFLLLLLLLFFLNTCMVCTYVITLYFFARVY